MRQCPYAPIYCEKDKKCCISCSVYLDLYIYGIQQILDKLNKEVTNEDK